MTCSKVEGRSAVQFEVDHELCNDDFLMIFL